VTNNLFAPIWRIASTMFWLCGGGSHALIARSGLNSCTLFILGEENFTYLEYANPVN
jgi:hypothetical protein